MIYLLQALSGWWIAALVLGLLVGLFVARPGRSAVWTIWSVLAACVYVLGAVAASLQSLPGRYGFWLETALLLLPLYLIGYALGAVSRRLFGRSKQPDFAAEAGLATESLAGQGVAFDAGQGAPKSAKGAFDGGRGAFDLEKGFAFDAATPEPQPQPGSNPYPEQAAEQDDLLRIRGIDESAAQGLRELGVQSFAQLAALTPEQERLFADKRPDCGPAERRLWIAQAQLIDGGVDPDLSPTGGGVRLDEGAALSLRAALPEIITPRLQDALYAGARPLSLRLPPLGEMDDLEKIDGIDPATAKRLNALGIWTYTQIACWSDQNIRWIGSYLAFPGRIERESWVGQAQALVD
jgi:predicted flap endonuclease-1-like 5' DNA nuclease